jgi:exonuclease VII large subunit
VARKSTPANGRDRLEEAMALLVQNQAAFLSRLAETDSRLAENEQRRLENERRYLEFERRHLEYERETAERFTRIEAQMAEIIRVLSEHGRLIERLTEAVREKIGFKAP